MNEPVNAGAVVRTKIPRVPPTVTDENRHFWLGGAEGELRFLRCDKCSLFVHPPAPVCRACRATQLSPAASSGRGVVTTFSVNHHNWAERDAQPYVVAVVTLSDQPALRLTTNVVGCDPDEVFIGMQVEVVFERCADVWVPLFRPVGNPGGQEGEPR